MPLTNIYAIQALVNFSFYGVKSLLLLYFTQDLVLTAQEAITIFSGMIASSYLISLAGGFFAFRLVPLRLCFLTSLTLLSIGGFLLGTGNHNSFLLWGGLTLFICGAGLFKPLVPLILDTSLERQSAGRERRFMIFYAVLNGGSLFGFLFCGFISQSYGKIGGFLTASLSALVSLFVSYRYQLFSEKTFSRTSTFNIVIYLCSVLLIICTLFMSIRYLSAFNIAFPFILVGTLFFFGGIYLKASQEEKKPILLCYLYAFLFAIFASIFEQTHSSLSLFLEYKTNRSLFSFTVPTSVFHGVGPFIIILYTLFSRQKKRPLHSKASVSYFNKQISFGFFMASLAFMILLGTLFLYPGEEKVPLIYSLLTYLCITIAEMSIVPICLSAITMFSPLRLKGIFVALWTLAIAYGTYFSGVIVNSSSSLSSSQSHSLDFFSIFMIAATLCFLMSLILGRAYFKHYFVRAFKFFSTSNNKVSAPVSSPSQ